MWQNSARARLVILLVLLLAGATAAFAQGGTGSPPQQAGDADLARQLSNPVASLVSVPLQFNWDQPIGPDDDTRFTVNFQPVVPMSLNDDWNMILRWIMPYVAQPRLFEGAAPTSGLSDIVASVFFSPARPGRFIWGVGPVLLLPATADPLLGTAKWGAGPTVVILKQTGGWTYGALVNHIWSFAGDDFSGGASRDDVDNTLLQPFASYTTPGAVTFTVNMEAAANWEADDEWTVPLHLMVSKVTRFGPFPFSIQGGIGLFLAAPDGRPDWRLRFVTTVLLPRGQ